MPGLKLLAHVLGRIEAALVFSHIRMRSHYRNRSTVADTELFATL